MLIDPNYQRNALIEWTKNSNYIKNHTISDKAYHFGRLLKRIEPMESSEEIYRGMSWNTKVESQKALFDKFLAEVDNGYFTRSTFESYSKNKNITFACSEMLSIFTWFFRNFVRLCLRYD